MTEALWTIGPAGTLAAYDGWASAPAAQFEAGLPAGRWPSLLSGGGLLWVYTADGDLAIVDPAGCRVLTRLTVPQARMPGLVAVRIDPGTNRAVRVREPAGDDCAAAVGPAPG